MIFLMNLFPASLPAGYMTCESEERRRSKTVAFGRKETSRLFETRAWRKRRREREKNQLDGQREREREEERGGEGRGKKLKKWKLIETIEKQRK